MKFPFPWQFYAFIAIMVVLNFGFPLAMRLWREMQEEQRFARAGLKDIKTMSGLDFEKYLERLFRNLGYQVERTPYQGDYGVDLILVHPSGKRTAVQAKRWKGKSVGVEALQQVIGGAAYHKCQETLVVTTSGYTDPAKRMAQETGTKLWGLNELVKAMEGQGKKQASQVASKPAPAGRPRAHAATPARGVSHSGGPSPAGPLCTLCGSATVKRQVSGKSIWLCSTYPACKGYRPAN